MFNLKVRCLSQPVLVIAACVIALLATAPGAQANNSSGSGASLNIHKLAVVPFITPGKDAREAKELKSTLDCALSGLCYNGQEVLTRTEKSLTGLLRQDIAEYYGDALVPQPPVTEHFLRMGKKLDDTPRDIAVRLGQQMGVDHVIIGILWRYQQRVGSPLSAKKPASVAFNLFLLDVASKKLVWQGSFEKTQEALSDNLFNASLFFKSGGVKWLSAEELADYGIQQTLRSLPR